MTISDLIESLRRKLDTHGDLPVYIGCEFDVPAEVIEFQPEIDKGINEDSVPACVVIG